MRIEKHLIGQKVIVRYMEDTDSDILGLGLGLQGRVWSETASFDKI